MKIKILITSLVVPFLLQAQVLNKAFHTGYQKTAGMVSINQKHFYLEILNSMGLQLHCLDNSGNTIFTKDFGFLPWCEKPSITVTANNQLFVTGGTLMQECDVGYQIFNVFRVDTSGATVSTWSITGAVKAWGLHSSGQFLVYVNDALERYDNSGTLLGTNSLYLSPDSWKPMEILSLLSGNLITSYSINSVNKLRKLTISGSPLVEVQTTHPCSQLRESSDSSIYAITNGHMVKYSPQLTLMHSSASLSQSGNIKAFTCHNDTIYAVGENTQHELYYLVLDSTLNLLHYAKSNIEFCSPTGITVSGPNTNIITTGITASVQGQSFAGWFQTSKTGTVISRQNAGVIDITVGAVIRLNSTVPAGLISNATVTVKNFGPDTLTTVHLNHFAYSGWPCYQLVGLLKPVTLSLPPNGTVALATGSFYTNLNGSTSEAQICIFTSIPNGMNDEDVQNDASCTTTIAVGIEAEESSSEVTMFPVPASNYLNIDSPVRVETVLISNSLGQTVLKVPLNGEKGFTTEALSPGVYFVRLQAGDRAFFNRVIIDR